MTSYWLQIAEQCFALCCCISTRAYIYVDQQHHHAVMFVHCSHPFSRHAVALCCSEQLVLMAAVDAAAAKRHGT
jgi:hypothetical protein